MKALRPIHACFIQPFAEADTYKITALARNINLFIYGVAVFLGPFVFTVWKGCAARDFFIQFPLFVGWILGVGLITTVALCFMYDTEPSGKALRSREQMWWLCRPEVCASFLKGNLDNGKELLRAERASENELARYFRNCSLFLRLSFNLRFLALGFVLYMLNNMRKLLKNLAMSVVVLATAGLVFGVLGVYAAVVFISYLCFDFCRRLGRFMTLRIWGCLATACVVASGLYLAVYTWILGGQINGRPVGQMEALGFSLVSGFVSWFVGKYVVCLVSSKVGAETKARLEGVGLGLWWRRAFCFWGRLKGFLDRDLPQTLCPSA